MGGQTLPYDAGTDPGAKRHRLWNGSLMSDTPAHSLIHGELSALFAVSHDNGGDAKRQIRITSGGYILTKPKSLLWITNSSDCCPRSSFL